MGRARAKDAGYGGVKSFPSPASSSASSSEFEFTVTQSPGSKQRSAAQLCPADDLFYKGQLLPLHLSPRISMVRTLLLASASTSSASASDSTSTSNSSRDSNGSTSSSFSTDCAALLLPDSAPSSSRPSSATDDDRHLNGKQYLSSFATRFSSVFLHRGGAPAAKKPSNKSLAKEVIKKYAKKVKPLIGMRPVSLSAASSSSMEELQSAIEGAIAHCKNTMGGVVSLCPRKVPAATAAGEISAF
ncbi:unnamed protein product [Triticum turgidum subsp. durum]|uniref:Membrane-associated kinase regulator 1 n=1 Tax=Triticum turgidum subsp. durum TaxID=4567 RepID=A0A9R0V937_TRITD|nr:unnamed protein product [Triticum turgidum subsp. durum]